MLAGEPRDAQRVVARDRSAREQAAQIRCDAPHDRRKVTLLGLALRGRKRIQKQIDYARLASQAVSLPRQRILLALQRGDLLVQTVAALLGDAGAKRRDLFAELAHLLL